MESHYLSSDLVFSEVHVCSCLLGFDDKLCGSFSAGRRRWGGIRTWGRQQKFLPAVFWSLCSTYFLSFFLFLNEQGMAFGIRRTFACLDFSGGGLAVPTTRGSFQARD